MELDCSSQIAGNEAKHVLEPNAESMWRTDNRDNAQHKTHWICLSLINIPRSTVIRTVGWHCASAYSSNPQSVFLHVSSDGIDFKAWDRFINPRQAKGTTLFCCSAPIDTEIYPYLVLEITSTFGDLPQQDVFEEENNHQQGGESSTNTGAGPLLDTYMEQIYVDKNALTNKSHGTYVYMNRIYLYSEEVPSSPLASLHRHSHHSPSSSSFSPSSSRMRPLPASPLPESYSPMPVSLSNHSSFLSPVRAMGCGDTTGRDVQQSAVEWPSFTRHGENSQSERSGLNSSGSRSTCDGESIRGNEGSDSSGNVSALHSALGLSEEVEEETERSNAGDNDNDDGYCDEDSLDHLSTSAATVTNQRPSEMDMAMVSTGSAVEVNTPRRESEPLPPAPSITAQALAVPPLPLPPLPLTESPSLAVIDDRDGVNGTKDEDKDGVRARASAAMTLPPLLLARMAYLEEQLAALSSSSTLSMVKATNEDCMTRLARLEEQVMAWRGERAAVGSSGREIQDNERDMCGGEGVLNDMPTTAITTEATSSSSVIAASAPLTSATTASSAVPVTTTTAAGTTAGTEKAVESESPPLVEAASEVPSEVMLLTALLHRKLSLRLLKQAQLALLLQQQQQPQQPVS